MTTLADTLLYTPVQPSFGTSGVRALVKDLTDLEVYSLTLGTLRYFQQSRLLTSNSSSKHTLQIPVAQDLRPSSPRLARACIKAIQDCDYQADYLGKIPTPALTCYALERGIASFMITGSHIPLDRNGQKANRFDGEVMKSDEAGIVAEVNKSRDTILNNAAEQSIFDANGMLKPEHNPSLPAPSSAAEFHYRQRYANIFPCGSLAGLRIVFFEYSAVGRDLLPDILRHAGAEVICMGRSDEFFPIDTEAISDQHLQELGGLVTQAQAEHGRIDALVSTDGDSDRPLVLAVEQAAGNDSIPSTNLRFIPGDLLGLLVSDYLGVDNISAPISSNPAILEYFSKHNTPVRLTKIGSPYVIESMQQASSQGYQRVVAWEANGGYLTGSDLSLSSGALPALPTRDAILPILCVLQATVKNKQSLSDMIDALPAWFGKAGLLDEFPKAVSQTILQQLSPAPDAVVSVQFQDDQMTYLNSDGEIIQQHNIDNHAGSKMMNSKRVIESVFSHQLGFGELTHLNCLDGIRCYFDNDVIAHIRPSGNAPQLRIYACARTQQRADKIVELAIQEPDGLLRQLAAQIEQSNSH